MPTVNGGLVSIEHLGVYVTKETLDVFICPSGAADKQLETIKLKAQGWTSRDEDSKFMQRDVWFLVDHQLWPKLSYGLCSVEMPWEILEKDLVKRWYNVLPLGAVWRAAPKQLRQLDGTFWCRLPPFGGGMPNTPVDEATHAFWL